MPRRIFNPLQIAALVGITLALALLWACNSSQPQEGQTIQITPAHTQTQRHTATLVAQVTHTHTPMPETDTPAPQAASPTPASSSPTPEPPTPTPSPTPSPTMTMRPTEKPTPAVLNPALRTQQELVADVDLNCDGLEERIVEIEVYKGDPASDKTEYWGTMGFGLQVPAQKGYHQVWEYKCQLGRYNYPDCYGLEIQLLATDNCEQLIALNGFAMDVKEVWRLIIFRWDGKDLSVVLDAPGTSIETTQDPLVVTITTQRSCDTPTRCKDQKASYTWNGTEFVRE